MDPPSNPNWDTCCLGLRFSFGGWILGLSVLDPDLSIADPQWENTVIFRSGESVAFGSTEQNMACRWYDPPNANWEPLFRGWGFITHTYNTVSWCQDTCWAPVLGYSHQLNPIFTGVGFNMEQEAARCHARHVLGKSRSVVQNDGTNTLWDSSAIMIQSNEVAVDPASTVLVWNPACNFIDELVDTQSAQHTHAVVPQQGFGTEFTALGIWFGNTQIVDVAALQLEPHNYVRVAVTFWFFGQWDNGYGRLYVDGTQAWEVQHDSSQNTVPIRGFYPLGGSAQWENAPSSTPAPNGHPVTAEFTVDPHTASSVALSASASCGSSTTGGGCKFAIVFGSVEAWSCEQ
eukprot:TRINITY_DN55223_c0_g1_i1.p1 TRINITY_DN55223_c0_g1~~TRINITY_DN55223_c0_g1_i1.p1  ORF type:complete len:345 (+),score=28.30 TRINITY_DN55223_c0_g1_i1:333-1367(+)